MGWFIEASLRKKEGTIDKHAKDQILEAKAIAHLENRKKEGVSRGLG